MHPDRWSEIEKLYHDVLEREPGERTAFLDHSCPDEELRREVQSLLANEQKGDRLFENSPWKPSLRQFASGEEPGPALAAGMRLGPYEIVSPIGAGGMGEVYRARDTRLNRTVAIKILAAHLDSDAARKRFEHEARALSSLNHPHICALYDVGHQDGIDYLVMEYLDGETLAQTLKKGRLPLDQALRFSIEIAEALDQAHRHGVIHRDLKPGNIMVTRDGHVKILDFGLAKQRRPAAESATLSLTEQGTVVGTAGYMSPEQVRGEELDQCSDLFSFGVILYEMLSGKQAFAGGSSVEVMNAVLKEQPPDLPATVPRALDRVVRRCLEKEPARRFQSAADLAFALQPASPSLEPARAPKRRPWLKWGALAGAALAGAGAVLFWLTRPLPPPRITNTVTITNDGRTKVPPLLTDGSRLFFNSGSLQPFDTYQVSVGGGESVALPLPLKNAYLLDISPDRREWLLCRFFNDYCELWVAPVVGGSARRLGDLVASGQSGGTGTAAWSPDGQQLVYVRDKELHIARSDGTEVRKLVKIAGDPFFVRWSPDGRRVRFSIDPHTGDGVSLWEARIDGNHAYPLLPAWNPSSSFSCCGNWTPDGKYFFFAASRKGNANIWALREKVGLFQRADRGPFQLTNGSLEAGSPVPSADGKRLFYEGYQPRSEFLRYDVKSGHLIPVFAGISGSELEFSRDGKWIVYAVVPDGSLWRSAVDGSQRLQLTSPPLQANLAHWSPDGKQIAFCGARGGNPPRIYVVSRDGGTLQQVTKGESGKEGDGDPSWSPDGASLVFGWTGYGTTPAPGDASIQKVDLKTGRISTLAGSAGMWSPRWSPNGRFIAGLSASGWKIVLYDLQTGKQSYLSSVQSGYQSWSVDGESLFYTTSGDDASWWRVRLRDRKTERVAQLKDLRGGGWFAPAPNNSLITARNVGTDEIYALDWEAP